MKLIKGLLVALIPIVIVGFAVLKLTGHDYVITAFQRTYMAGNATANINDAAQFDTRKISAGEKQTLLNHPDYGRKTLSSEFISELEKYDTAAFLVLEDGKVLSETYFNGYSDRSRTNSFSMAKTVVTLLLGIAIEEGHIDGLDQALVDLLPEFENDPLGAKANLGQLSLMNSGYEWDEHYYSPFSPTVELLYGDDVEAFLLKGEFSAEPGSFWEYSSASTQLLGIALTRALRKAGAAQNLSEYLSQKLWQPMQMNDDAVWHTDEAGMELVFCCINTNARNYAKLGQLMLNNGKWLGQQLVPAEFIKQMSKPAGQPFYGLSTWLGIDPELDYYSMNGHLGQYVVVVPRYNLVIVRLGERNDADKELRGEIVPEFVQAALEIAKP